MPAEHSVDSDVQLNRFEWGSLIENGDSYGCCLLTTGCLGRVVGLCSTVGMKRSTEEVPKKFDPFQLCHQQPAQTTEGQELPPFCRRQNMPGPQSAGLAQSGSQLNLVGLAPTKRSYSTPQECNASNVGSQSKENLRHITEHSSESTFSHSLAIMNPSFKRKYSTMDDRDHNRGAEAHQNSSNSCANSELDEARQTPRAPDVSPALRGAIAQLLGQVQSNGICHLTVSIEPQLQRRSIFDETDPALKQRVLNLIERDSNAGLDRARGCLVGLAVADGLGHNFEFVPVQGKPQSGGPRLEPPSAAHPRGLLHRPYNKFQLLPGQWTDDTSMALCMADSLLARGEYDGADMRVWFWNWWYNGLNNAFRLDTERQRKAGGRGMSVGLGGNISKSLEQLTELTRQGQKIAGRFEAQTEDAGNGSIMRLAPVALRYHHSTADARRMAYESSLTTHPGRVAAEACALLAHLLARALQRHPRDARTARRWLDDEAALYEGILRGAGEPDKARAEVLRLLAATEPDTSLERCWNWRSECLGLEATLRNRGARYNGYPVTAEYFGAFSLDGLSMALHAFYTTASFDEAIVKVVNMAGDADTTGAVCGQLAGAFYGLGGINRPWVDDVRRWSAGEIDLRAVALYVAGIGQPQRS